MSLHASAAVRAALSLTLALVLAVVGLTPASATPTQTPRGADAALQVGLTLGAEHDGPDEAPAAQAGTAQTTQAGATQAASGDPATPSSTDRSDQQLEALTNPVTVEDNLAAPDEGSEPESALPAAVLDALDDDEQVSVIVHLSEQADLDEVRLAADLAGMRAEATSSVDSVSDLHAAAKDARTATVVRELKAAATTPAHDRVEDILADAETQGHASAVQDFWIINGFSATVDRETATELAEHPDVDRVELDGEVRAPEPTSSPLLPTWGLDTIKAPRTWGAYDHRGEGVVVAVLDTGVDGGHPALAPSYRGADGDHSDSWYVPTGENYPTPHDGQGHGTHVTGTITGGTPGEVTGVAPEAEWIGVKIFDDHGLTTDSTILDGAQWVLAPGGDPSKAPDVVNNSWGASDPNRTTYWDSVEAWRAAGIFPVFANGNDGPQSGTVGSPGSFPMSFGVGATDVNDQIAAFSSRGPVTWDGEEIIKPDVSAPGGQIFSTWPRNLGQDYNTISGTSMAAPHVSGAVALLLSASPDLTIDQIWETLEGTARVEDHMGEVPNNNYGHGIIDTYAATSVVAHSGRLTGTVTGPEGPLEATVSVDGGDFEVVSDPATGSYAVTVPTGGAEVSVSAFGYLTETFTIEVGVGEVAQREVSLEEAPSSTITGVVTADGTPAAGAVVSLGADGTPVAEAVTGPEGAYTLAVPHGTYQLRASLAGFLPHAQDLSIDGDLDLDIDLAPLTTPALDGWSQAQNGPARLGLTRDSVTPSTFAESWSVDLDGDAFFSSPVVSNGRLFLATTTGADSFLTALDSTTGERLWTHRGGRNLRVTPAITDDAVITSDGGNNAILALDPATGAQLWSYSTGEESTVYASPAVLDGVAYVATGLGLDNGGFVHAIDITTGEGLWRSEVGPQVLFGPAVSDGVVVAASYQTGVVRAFEATTGEQLWEFAHPTHSILASPAIADGVAYLGTGAATNGSLLALDLETGAVIWEASEHGGAQGSTPAIYHDTVIAGSHGKGFVRAYDRATGEVRWTHSTRYAVSSPQSVSSDGVVLGGSQSGIAFALDATTGSVLWEEQLSAGILSAPAVVDGTAYLVDQSGTVSAQTSSGTVSGSVTGPDGPVSAHVEVVETGELTETDADGAYVLAHRPGEWTVRTSAYGFAAQEESVLVVGGQDVPLDVELVPVGTGSLAGTVTAGDDPVTAATITVVDPVGEAVVPTAETDDTGAYAVAEVAAGDYTVLVDAEGYAPFSADVTIVEGEASVLDASLQRYDVAVVADHEGAVSRLLTGRDWLVDEVGYDDIAGTVAHYSAVALVGTPQDPATEETLTALVAEADEAGVPLVALDQNGATSGSVGQLLAVTDSGTLGEEHKWRGTTWLQDVVDHPATQSLSTDGPTDLLNPVDAAWVDDFTGTTLATVGTYSGGVRGTGVGYLARSLGHAHVVLPLHAPTADISPDLNWQPAMTDLLDDTLTWAVSAEFGEVTGAITDAAGDPVEVDVQVIDGPSVPATSAGYRLLLEPGSYTLRISAPGWVTQEQQVTISGGASQVLDWSLVAGESGTVTGTVSDQSGAPLAGATVNVNDTDLSTTSAEDGTFTIADVPAGTWTLGAAADGHTPETIPDIDVEAGSSTTVDIILRAAPSVAVIGDNDGALAGWLTEQGVPAVSTDWAVTEDLSAVDVVILAHPSDPGEEAFLAHLAAFDEAGVGVIASGGINAYTIGGAYLFQEHLGEPGQIQAVGGGGQNIMMTGATPHPAFAGLPSELPWQVTYAGESAGFGDHAGIPIATMTADEQDQRGPAAIYYPQVNGSVRVMAGGLGASFRNIPGETWTPEAEDYYLNLVRWAAAPSLGTLEGQVTGPGGFALPEATVTLPEIGFTLTADAEGEVSQTLHTGTYQVTYSAFGFEEATGTVTITEGGVGDVSIELAPDGVGTVSGTISSAGSVGTGTTAETAAETPTETDGVALEGAIVSLIGTPRTTTTAADGTFELPFVAPGEHQVEITDGTEHVRRLVDITVAAGATTTVDRTLRVSPLVGVLDDYSAPGREPSVRTFLNAWGYRVSDVTWSDPTVLSEIDLLVANGATFGEVPSAAEFAAFDDALNRNDVSTLWLGTQFGRGTIQYLNQFTGDPEQEGDGADAGIVNAQVAEGQSDHPLLAGIDLTDGAFPLVQADDSYQWFSGYSGTTIASLSTQADGMLGETIAVKGRTTGAVDVLLSTLASSLNGALSTPDRPSTAFTPEAEQLFLNALDYGLDTEGVGGEVRGVVTADGVTVPSTITVEETGRTYTGRDGDGSFVVPLDPGTWTLQVAAYGYLPQTHEVSVSAGESVQLDITLTADAGGVVTGTITDPAGAPLADVTATVGGRTAVTDANGHYTLPTVPVGTHTISYTADGLRTETRQVSLEDGQSVTVDVTMSAAAQLALIGDRNTDMGTLLQDAAYQVDSFAYAAIADVTPVVGDYDAIVVNGFGTKPGQEDFQAFLDAAEAAEVSVVLTGQYSSGAIRHLSDYTGDPTAYARGSTPDLLNYRVTTAHPIFAGFEVGDLVPIQTRPDANATYQFFEGYSGVTLATLTSGDGATEFGDGLAYRFTSPGSVQLLLGSLAASSYGTPADPNRWTPQATTVLVNGIDWAIDASQSVVTGTVTADGEPVAGATVVAVEAGTTATTTVEGTYRLGVPEGTHTVEATLPGYGTASGTVTVGDGETATLDLTMVKEPRGTAAVTVVDAATGDPVAGAQVAVGDTTIETADNGVAVVADLLPGTHDVTVSRSGYLDGMTEVTVVAGEEAAVTVELVANDVLVLGDTEDETLTDFLVEHGVAASADTWSDATLDGQRAVVINGGDPTETQFDDLVAAAGEQDVDLVVLGTHSMAGGGGTALLEEFGDDLGYQVGTEGYGDGPVSLTTTAPEHPLFAGLSDPGQVLADGGYYALLDTHPGEVLAEIAVDGADGPTASGPGVTVAFQGTTDVHLVLSFLAVSPFQGPDLGWTEDAETLLLNALDWVDDAQLAPPVPPSLTTEEALVATAEVEVSGVAPDADAVTLTVDDTEVGSVTPDADGAFAATIPLTEGPNEVVALATNAAGSTPSEPLVVTLDTTAPELTWSPEDGSHVLETELVVTGSTTDLYADPVSVQVNGTEVSVTEDGNFEAPVTLVEGDNTLTVTATDALGNTVTQERTVHSHALDVAVSVTGKGAVLPVSVTVTDADGAPHQAEGATVTALQDGEVLTGPDALRWAGGQFKGVIRGLPRGIGEVQLVVTLTLDGQEVSAAPVTIQR
ncbi:carboxypeptidase regulatory-like domain-containing protein [Ornithinimicrobium faecis]|uniref:alpha-amylase n=1 Tax=Ornithinimicrobium faecis TaxID=2934158 RepID=A0ABY4YN01_9MICO|nr:carboxypeptidase regulatory-like domain-containing protein [Ornithinimicrobium sp. HY1793]USQ78187.1 carboxypeptidase regulatory-like domain-containing protein [Ornithinimicrobium sp. HY1793]